MTEDILDVAIVTQQTNQTIEASRWSKIIIHFFQYLINLLILIGDLNTRSFQYGRRLNSGAAALGS